METYLDADRLTGLQRGGVVQLEVFHHGAVGITAHQFAVHQLPQIREHQYGVRDVEILGQLHDRENRVIHRVEQLLTAHGAVSLGRAGGGHVGVVEQTGHSASGITEVRDALGMFLRTTVRQLGLHRVDRHVLGAGGAQLVQAVMTFNARITQFNLVQLCGLSDTRQIGCVGADELAQGNAVIGTIVPVGGVFRDVSGETDVLQVGDVGIRYGIQTSFQTGQLADVERCTAVGISHHFRYLNLASVTDVLGQPRVARQSFFVNCYNLRHGH